MKYLLLIIMLSVTSCGTLGGFDSYEFPTTKRILVSSIDSIYKSYPKYEIPERLKHLDNWKKRGYDFMDSRIFYFKENPEEMYYVTFLEYPIDTIKLTSKPVKISIRSVYNGTQRWLLEEDFDKKERERVERRFSNEIISKLEHFSGVKSKQE